MKPNFSVVLIARNESKTIGRLLTSLNEFRIRGGEVVVVDTGSTDDTASIARGYGCRVYEEGSRFIRTITDKQAYQINRQFRDPSEPEIITRGDTLFDFAGARNYAASLATNDLIAMPDCDEIYTALDLDAIEEARARGVEQFEYNFVFAHDEFGGELVKFLHSKFYDRRKLKWEGIIHEVLAGQATREFFPESVIKLEHFQNPETNRGGYLKGLALDVLEHPENDRHSHYLGRELLYTGRPKSAIKELRRHVAMGKWPEERSQSLLHIGDALMGMGKVQEAIHEWIDAQDACAARREPLMRIAEYYDRAGSPEHVIIYASAAIQIPQSNFYAAFQPYYQHLPHELLYKALWAKGNKESALAHFEVAIACQPYNSKYLHDTRFFYKLPKVSIIVPTLRPAGLERLMASIKNLNYPAELIETIVLEDSPRLGVPKRVKEGVEKTTGEWVVYAADDMEFHPDAISAALQKSRLTGDKGLIAFNAGPVSPDKGNICEHFMIFRDLALDPKYFPNGIFDTDFHHVGVDNLLWATMEKAGEAVRCEEAKITHHHFSRGGEMDEVYKQAWDPELVAKDRALLEKKLSAL